MEIHDNYRREKIVEHGNVKLQEICEDENSQFENLEETPTRMFHKKILSLALNNSFFTCFMAMAPSFFECSLMLARKSWKRTHTCIETAYTDRLIFIVIQTVLCSGVLLKRGSVAGVHGAEMLIYITYHTLPSRVLRSILYRVAQKNVPPL
jgi:hypothetical protein